MIAGDPNVAKVELIARALGPLREAWRARRFTMDELDHYARICRVQRVMRPYLEALVA